MKTYHLEILGLSSVGLTLTSVLAEAGNAVIGVGKCADVADPTNQGVPPISQAVLSDALTGVTGSGNSLAVQQFGKSAACDFHIFTERTPLSSNGNVRLGVIGAASRQVAEGSYCSAGPAELVA